MNQAVLALLEDALRRKSIQHGEFSGTRTIVLQKQPIQLLMFSFNGETVYCPVHEFADREIKSFSGFMDTKVSFIVEKIQPMEDDYLVLVSRKKALPQLYASFKKNYEVGMVVDAVITGFIPDKNIVFVDIDSVPAIILPRNWSDEHVSEIASEVEIGATIQVKIIEIGEKSIKTKDSNDKAALDFNVACSRKDVILMERAKKWANIGLYHAESDQVSAKIVAQLPGNNKYLVKLRSSGIVIHATSIEAISKKRNFGIPIGSKVTVRIERLDPENQRGSGLIVREDSSLKIAVAK